MDHSDMQLSWSELNSRQFIDYGKYFVPARAQQIQLLCDLVSPSSEPVQLLELCCGEGLLAEALLERYPRAVLTGCDGSPAMLERATQRLACFGVRFKPCLFNLAGDAWRSRRPQYHAVLSSLAIHHLDDAAKQALYADLFHLLLPGGVFLVADLILPLGKQAYQVAASAWDAVVYQQAIEIDGQPDAYEYFIQAGWNTFRHPDPVDQPSALGDHLRWLAAAGYQDVDVYWAMAGHAIWGAARPVE